MDKPKDENKPEQPKVARSAKELSYTEKYEYAASLVKLYLDREVSLAEITEPGIPTIYQENGPLYVLFTTFYKFLANKTVAEEICKYLEIDHFKDPPPEKGAIVRLYGVFFDIVAACGFDFITELIGNVRKTTILTSGVSSDKVVEFSAQMDELFGRIPIVVLFIIGAKDYYTRYIENRVAAKRAALSSQKQKTNRKAAEQVLSQT